MKDLVKFDQEIGGDGAKAAGGLGVSGSEIKLHVEVTYPIAKVIDPVMKKVDWLVDELEKLIPGDQKAIAGVLKAQAREEILKVLAE